MLKSGRSWYSQSWQVVVLRTNGANTTRWLCHLLRFGQLLRTLEEAPFEGQNYTYRYCQTFESMNFRKGDEMTGSDMTQSSHLSKCRSRSDSFLRDTSSRAVSEVWKGAPLVQSRHTVLPSPLCSSSFAWAVFRPGSNPFASLRAISESRQRFFGFLLQDFPTFTKLWFSYRELGRQGRDLFGEIFALLLALSLQTLGLSFASCDCPFV